MKMNATRARYLVVFFSLCFSLANAQAAEPIALFNGKTLEGWEGDTEHTWRVEQGAITAGSLTAAAARNEFLSTKKEYANFDLRLKFKIEGDVKVNAGVQFRTKRIPNHHEVSGFQADIGPGYFGCLYDESRRNRMLGTASKETINEALGKVAADGWHEYRIRAEGNHIQLWLNGVPTVDYTETDPKIDTSGIIAVQIHGGMQGKIMYKDLQLEPLP